MKRRPWPLPKLLAENRNAIAVFAALRWLAGDHRQLNTTRRRIGEVCCMHEDTITSAMQTLHSASWIRLNYGRDGVKRWYRITFPKAGFFAMGVQTGFSRVLSNSAGRREHCTDQFFDWPGGGGPTVEHANP